jgi:hypothetical protein
MPGIHRHGGAGTGDESIIRAPGISQDRCQRAGNGMRWLAVPMLVAALAVEPDQAGLNRITGMDRVVRR